MFRRIHLLVIFAAALLIAGTTDASAQFASVSGKVELVKADGTREPVSGALIESYRVDIKSGGPKTSTNKKGEFAFAGFQVGAVFAFSVSAPGCTPTIFPNVKAGQEKLLISLTPGDGRKWTEDEVRKAMSEGAKSGGTPTAESSAEAKKQQAEYEAKVKEIEAKNAKVKQTDEIIRKALQEGNDAFTAKNYDLAIAKYEEGIQADPNYVGSAPVMLNNKGTSLMLRGVDTYNKNAKSTDATVKIEAFGKAKADFSDSLASYNRSYEIIKNAAATDITDAANTEANRIGAIRGAKDAIRYAVLTEQIGDGMVELGAKLIPEYIAIEPDAGKKNEGRLLIADMYRVAGESEKAIEAYKAILETSPDNIDALAGAGLSLVNLGYINGDKTKLQEGANLLQKYAGLAPDGHKFKLDAVGLIDTLKKEQNVTPQKVTNKKKP